MNGLLGSRTFLEKVAVLCHCGVYLVFGPFLLYSFCFPVAKREAAFLHDASDSPQAVSNEAHHGTTALET